MRHLRWNRREHRQLPVRVKSEDYLKHGSDIVALLVLEHQSQMHNLITRASFEARTAAHQDAGINEALNRPRDQASESTGRRIASVGEKLLRYMLLADEIELTDAVSSSSTFAQEFSARGPRDVKADRCTNWICRSGCSVTPAAFWFTASRLIVCQTR